MKKQEWKEKHQAARILRQARFAGPYKAKGRYDTDGARGIVRDVYWQFLIDNPEIENCMDGAHFLVYDITRNEDKSIICMRLNSSAFGRKEPTRESKLKWGNQQ